MTEKMDRISIGIAWCLAWGEEKKPKYGLEILRHMRQALEKAEDVPLEVADVVNAVKELNKLEFPETLAQLKELIEKYPLLWNSRIGLVYGGATKIKQYVFEESKLPDIRGASALLDRINLVDLPVFFNNYKYVPVNISRSISIEQWLKSNFPGLEEALIPELIIYSTGGNILALCPAAFVDDLANAIEKRYTEETLTANSCAVGAAFKPLEFRFGLLNQPIETTFWLDKYQQNLQHPLINAYFAKQDINFNQEPLLAFKERKSFNELVGKLASLFNQRRNGNQFDNRSSRCYPPVFETHPYLHRDEGDYRSAVMQAQSLPSQPWFSETSARKRIVGLISKRDDSSRDWYNQAGFSWEPNPIYIPSWVEKFEGFLKTDSRLASQYYQDCQNPEEARSLIEIGNASKPDGFVAYIYADGNNMGGYIQKIQTPQAYQEFSNDIFEATEESVYIALAQHLHPHHLNNIKDPDKIKRNGHWIHPFEILTIGGDDVMLIVPADKALAIAKTIGEEFERILLSKGEKYKLTNGYNPKIVHRYRQTEQKQVTQQSQLSMSIGVLITAEDTPIYYAERLTSQLLKSAKKKAKELKQYGYYGGTVDFLVMKSVTMISSNIGEFRNHGLTKYVNGQQKLKLYAAPYTLQEVGGILETVKAFKDTNFPKSQIYQIRSLLERGKQTAILNYRYFKVRLQDKNAQYLLTEQFEERWCQPKDENNKGNLAPWMSLKGSQGEKQENHQKVSYETIWRDLVDLYPFVEKSQDKSDSTTLQASTGRQS